MKSPDRATWIVIACIAALAFAWAAYSQQAWEDYYITYRASKNLADGHGLTFTAGQKVHSFTSPLGVLLPALTYLATGRSSDAAALWLFRLGSIAALAVACALLWRTMRHLCLTLAPAVLLVALLATDSKTVSFSINGMETGFLLLFAAWAIWSVFTLPQRLVLHLGLAWGGMMWSRPDSCIYIAAMGAAALLFAPAPADTANGRRALWWLRQMAAAGVVCALVYGPWVVWAKWYYGTPIPHTITAKGLFNHTDAGTLLAALLDFPARIAAGESSLRWTFLPAYGVPGDWPKLVPAVTGWLAIAPLFVFLLPFVRREARFCSFVYVVGHFYLTAIVSSPAPWYLPLATWFGLMTYALCFGQALSATERLQNSLPAPENIRSLRRTLHLVAVILVLGGACLSVLMCRQAHVEMKISEAMVRKPIGEWLHAHALSPRETVFLEPLGFIGYYSQLKMLDYPGLGSPEVVAARKRAHVRPYLESWPELVRDLQPVWIVLRPIEEKYFAEHDLPLLREDYRLVEKFDATAAVRDAGWIPIRGFVEFNTRFSIYRRRSAPALGGGATLSSLFRPSLQDFTRKDSLVPVADTGEGGFAVHAPSVLTLPLPAGARRLSGRMGFNPGAYKDPLPNATDGAEFSIVSVDASGARETLLKRWIEPSTTIADRAPQDFELDLPAGVASVDLEVSPGPMNRPNFDWAIWDRLLVASPAK